MVPTIQQWTWVTKSTKRHSMSVSKLFETDIDYMANNNPGIRPILQLLKRALRSSSNRQLAIRTPCSTVRFKGIQRRTNRRDMLSGDTRMDKPKRSVDREWNCSVQSLYTISASEYHVLTSSGSGFDRRLPVLRYHGSQGHF